MNQKISCIRRFSSEDDIIENKMHDYHIEKNWHTAAGILLYFFLENVSGDCREFKCLFTSIKNEEDYGFDNFYIYYENGMVVLREMLCTEQYPCELYFKKEYFLEGIKQWFNLFQANKNKIVLQLSDDNKISVYTEY